MPESFKVLIMELRSLGLAVEVISEEEKVSPAEEIKEGTEPEATLEAAKDSTLKEVKEDNAGS